MQVVRDRTEGETGVRGQWSRVVQFVTPEEGSLFSCSLGTATHVLGMLGRAGVSPGLKHDLAGGGVGSRGEGVLGYLRVHKVHSRTCNVKVC